jgi:hypothetical protein
MKNDMNDGLHAVLKVAQQPGFREGFNPGIIFD